MVAMDVRLRHRRLSYDRADAGQVRADGLSRRCAAEDVVALSGYADGPVTLDLPPRDAAGRGQLEITFAPSLAADLADTLGYLVEYPYGCVEQTMSRFLPALRTAAILRQAGISTVKQLEEKLPKVVEAGQKRLIELQHPDGGWGYAPGHSPQLEPSCLGLLALSLESDRYAEQIKKTRDFVERNAGDEGSYYLAGRFREPSADVLCEDLLTKVGIAAVPASAFPGSAEERWMRFCFGVSDAQIEEACRRLARLPEAIPGLVGAV